MIQAVQELVAFFSDTVLWRAIDEFSEGAVCSKDDEVIVLDEDHVRDGVEGGVPFLDGAFHFFFGLFSVGDVLDDEGDARFSVVEGGRDVFDAKVESLVVLEVLFFDAVCCSFERLFRVLCEFRDLKKRNSECLDRFSDDIGALDVDEF